MLQGSTHAKARGQSLKPDPYQAHNFPGILQDPHTCIILEPEKEFPVKVIETKIAQLFQWESFTDPNTQFTI